MTAATKEAVQAKGGAERLSDIKYPLWDVICWTSILDTVVENAGRHRLSGREREVATGQISRVKDELKKAVDELFDAYHGPDVFEKKSGAAEEEATQ
jgi:hypothetical protein